MISANHYPEISSNKTRLSEHKDVSFVSIFPYGIGEGLMIQNTQKKWVEIKPTNTIIGFYGYLMECLSEKEVMATNHKVLTSI